MKRKKPRTVVLSFEVVRIIERFAPYTRVAIFDTDLRHYTTDAIIVIRGKPWPLGTKVDFKEMPRDEPPK